MIEFRITKARTVELIREYKGKYNGMELVLKEGGIDIDRPYIQKRDDITGDYIYTQEELKPEHPKKVEFLKKVAKKAKKGK